MKFNLLLIMATLSLVATSPVFAHDHGSMPMGGMSPSAPVDDQSAKECAKILDKCAQQAASIQGCIARLQAEITGRNVGHSVHEELQKLEKQLKEANETVRALQIM